MVQAGTWEVAPHIEPRRLMACSCLACGRQFRWQRDSPRLTPNKLTTNTTQRLITFGTWAKSEARLARRAEGDAHRARQYGRCLALASHCSSSSMHVWVIRHFSGQCEQEWHASTCSTSRGVGVDGLSQFPPAAQSISPPHTAIAREADGPYRDPVFCAPSRARMTCSLHTTTP